MKRSEIEPGMEVAVYVQSAYIPHGRLDTGEVDRNDPLTEVAQSNNHPSRAYSNESHTHRAKVVEVGAAHYERTYTYGSVWHERKNGILVRLRKKLRAGWAQEEFTLFSAVPQQVISTWEDFERRKLAAEKRDAAWRTRCDQFEPVLDEFLQRLRDAGFRDVAVYPDGSGIHARDLAIKLHAYEGRAHSFGGVSAVTLDLDVFVRMLGEAGT